MNVNKKILEYLKKERISQSELANKTGIIQQNLNRLLNSKDIKISQLIEITKALELPVTYFFDGTESISNDEIEKDKKRIAELEEIISDKNYIINDMKRSLSGHVSVEVKNVKNLLNDVLENEFKALSKEDKREAFKIVVIEASMAYGGVSFRYNLNKRSEIIRCIENKGVM